MVPTACPSVTRPPRVTAIDPRWTRVTEKPSAVSIVTLSPFPGTEPANETTPLRGAATGAPASPPTSMPRCWPAAYGSLP
jgi:hypothetical protein